MDTREPTFGNFVAAFRNNVADAMSGGFSVPFTALGVLLAIYAKDSNAALVGAAIFLALGFASIWYGAYRLWSEERKNVISLDKTERREAVRAELGELRANGVTLRNLACPGVLAGNQWQEWIENSVIWDAKVRRVIEKVSVADAIWFATADIMPPPRIELMVDVGMTDDEVFVAGKAFQLHDFRLVKLAQLITGEQGTIFVRR